MKLYTQKLESLEERRKVISLKFAKGCIKNENFSILLQPIAGRNIFCNIFTSFLQNTRFSLWRTQLKRFLKNSNSQRCGFDRQLQPIAGRNIFCKIFATFLQKTRFSLWRTQLKRFLKNSNSQRSIYDRQFESNAGKNIFATILHLFHQFFAKHVFASGEHSLRDF